jgi:hypothetical protein
VMMVSEVRERPVIRAARAAVLSPCAVGPAIAGEACAG